MITAPDTPGASVANIGAFGAPGAALPRTAASPEFGTQGMYTYNILDRRVFPPSVPNGPPLVAGPMGVNGVAVGLIPMS